MDSLHSHELLDVLEKVHVESVQPTQGKKHRRENHHEAVVSLQLQEHLVEQQPEHLAEHVKHLVEQSTGGCWPSCLVRVVDATRCAHAARARSALCSVS